MEYKYYTVITFGLIEDAVAFSQSYHSSPNQDIEKTKYRFPISYTDTEKPCVVIYDLNDLTVADFLKVSIEKVNTDFISY